MKNNIDCRIIQDLLPLYVDGLTSEYTSNVIEEHIKECTECAQSLSYMTDSNDTLNVNPQEVNFLKKLNKKLTQWKTISISTLLIFFLCIWAANMIYQRVIPREFEEILGRTLRGDITFVIEDISSGHIKEFEDDSFLYALRNTNFFYSGKQDNTIVGYLWIIDIYDSRGLVVDNMFLTNNRNIYYNDKEYHFNDFESLDYLYDLFSLR